MAEGGIANLVELSERFHIEGIVDVPDKLHNKLLGYKIIATDDDLPQLVKKMKVSYDKEVDELYIELSTQKPDDIPNMNESKLDALYGERIGTARIAGKVEQVQEAIR